MDGHSDIRRMVWQQTLSEVKHSDEHNDTSRDPCVICLEDVSEKAVAIPCRHDQFDFLCLASWLEERTQCPLCKSNVDTVRYGIESETDYKVYQIPPKSNKHVPPVPRPIQRQRRTQQARRRACERAPSLSAAIRRRREVYRRGLFSLHVGSNRISRFQELTPAMFNRDAELVPRARNWIRRELRVFEYLDSSSQERASSEVRGNNAEFLLEYCVAILKTVNIRDASGQAEDMLQEFLGRQNARLFLHELSSWLRSPYTSLEAWDRHVQYSENLDSEVEASHDSNNSADERARKRRRSPAQSVGYHSDDCERRRVRNVHHSSRLYDSYRPTY